MKYLLKSVTRTIIKPFMYYTLLQIPETYQFAYISKNILFPLKILVLIWNVCYYLMVMVELFDLRDNDEKRSWLPHVLNDCLVLSNIVLTK